MPIWIRLYFDSVSGVEFGHFDQALADVEAISRLYFELARNAG